MLRKHSYLLRDYPHLLFQCLVNEGFPEVSFKAATILEKEFFHVSYMKYLATEKQEGIVQARFYCSDTVACIDVSPENGLYGVRMPRRNHSFMVSEDREQRMAEALINHKTI